MKWFIAIIIFVLLVFAVIGISTIVMMVFSTRDIEWEREARKSHERSNNNKNGK